MSALRQEFEAAVVRSKQLAERPANDELLKLYALYKQATAGDAAGERPGLAEFVARAKHDAWTALQGQSAEDAMRAYIGLVAELEERTKT